MNRLEELAGELLELINGGSEQRVLEEAAAILLAASKADVAGLMALIKTVPPRDSWPERNAHMAQLESALRLLVAERDALRAGQDAEIDRLKAQVAELALWRESAFMAHPNIDLDIDTAMKEKP